MTIDVKSPQERIKNVFDLIKSEIVITNLANFKLLNGTIENDKSLLIDEVDFDQEPNSSFLNSRMDFQIDTDPLCIINISGSTGTPKGVFLNHRSFIEFTEVSIEIVKFSNHDVIGSLFPLVFDIYSFELCLLMSQGSTLLFMPEQLSAFPIKILELLKLHQVIFLGVPTIIVNIANMNLLEYV